MNPSGQMFDILNFVKVHPTLQQVIDNVPIKVMAGVTLVFFTGMLMGAFGYTKFFTAKLASENHEQIAVNYPLPVLIEEKEKLQKMPKLLIFFNWSWWCRTLRWRFDGRYNCCPYKCN